MIAQKLNIIYLFAIIAVTSFFTLTGCSDVDPSKGYTSQSLYRDDIQTIHIPQFQNQTLVRNVEYDLTASLCRRIEQHTGYKIISDGSAADTILYGTVVNVQNRVANQQRELDRPMKNFVNLNVVITWKDERSGDFLINDKNYRLNTPFSALNDIAITSALRQAVDEIAIRIVEDMEKPW